jgi:ABC-type multidrug transport system ATPase subunit/ABC-type multidrug transport system permease subunit
MTEPEKIRSIVCQNMCVGYKKSGPWVSNHITFEVHSGEILAIMGPSGAGKSTLLKGLLGEAPFVSGTIRVNGHDLSSSGGLSSVSHKVGRVPQSDILVDELSMVENIEYFHTIAVDSALSKQDLRDRIAKELADMGLEDNPADGKSGLTRKRIGNGDGRKANISGGQAKRANIAMELINDPDVLIIDEPTSGLSSHDSLTLVRKLKDIAKTGKIVIIIIHQPSSDVFKLFDRLMLLDGGGNCIRSGLRDEVLQWLQSNAANQVRYKCVICDSSFPDKVLQSIELKESEKVAKIDRKYWSSESQAFADSFQPKPSETSPLPKRDLLRPFQAVRDVWALLRRHLLVKRRDLLSVVLTVGIPPLLGWLFATVFKAAPDGHAYSFANNALFPQLLFMLIVSTMFLGMVNSAVEVVKDRPILEREASRGLRMWAYLGTKFAAVMVFGAIQSLLLTAAACWFAEAPHLFWPLLTVVLLVMTVSVALGLLISVLSSTATKAFNLIQLVLLPQIVLGGALLSYNDMGSGLYLWQDKVAGQRPILAAAMPASWAHEFGMRLLYDKSQGDSHDINVGLADMRHIERAGFMSLKPDRELIPWSQAHWSDLRGKTYTIDALVLLAIVLGASLLAWAWVGKPYKAGPGGTAVRLSTLALVFAGLPLGVLSLVQATPVIASSKLADIDFIPAPTPMTWTKATLYCAGRKAQVASLEEFVSIYKSVHAELTTGAYWLAPASPVLTKPGSMPTIPALVQTAKLEQLPLEKLSTSLVRSTPKAWQAKSDPMQSQRFICVPGGPMVPVKK